MEMSTYINYEDEVRTEAEEFVDEHREEFIELVLNDQEFHDNDELAYETFDQDITDRAYTAEDAIFVLDHCTNEETDRGLWEGCDDWRDELSRRAAYSFANDVREEVESILTDLKEEYDTALDASPEYKKYLEKGEEDNFDEEEAIKRSIISALIADAVCERVEPLEPGSNAERRAIREWFEEGKDAGSWRSYPLGSSYIDARCGVGYGMPEVFNYVALDRKTAKLLPHLAGKYRQDIEAYYEKTFGESPLQQC